MERPRALLPLHTSIDWRRNEVFRFGLFPGVQSPTTSWPLASDQDLRQATQLISLATGLPKTKPYVKDKLLEWNDIPPVSEDYNMARTALVEQVRKLVDALSKPKKPQ
jgi:hypothetical protein